MKTRCMCGKPDFASVGIKQLLNGNFDNFGYHLNPDDCLHFKVATTECERCGRGLCEDCRVLNFHVEIMFSYMDTYKYITQTSRCPTCAEVRR